MPTLYHREIRGHFIILGRGDQGSIADLAEAIVGDLVRHLEVDAFVVLFRREGEVPVWDQLLTAGGRYVGVAEGAPSLDATMALFDQATPRQRAARQTALVRATLAQVDDNPQLAWETPAPPGSGLERMQGWLVTIGRAPRYVMVAIWPSGGFVLAPEITPAQPNALADCLAALPALECDPTALTA